MVMNGAEMHRHCDSPTKAIAMDSLLACTRSAQEPVMTLTIICQLPLLYALHGDIAWWR